MKQSIARRRGGRAGIVCQLIANLRFLRRWRGSEQDGRMKIGPLLRLAELGELEAALDELGRRRCRKLERARIPPLQLRQAPARADLRLQQAKVGLRRND